MDILEAEIMKEEIEERLLREIKTFEKASGLKVVDVLVLRLPRTVNDSEEGVLYSVALQCKL